LQASHRAGFEFEFLNVEFEFFLLCVKFQLIVGFVLQLLERSAVYSAS